MRRYELMLLFRPDLEDDKLQSAVERVTRAIVNAGGALTKVSPWGKRRLAYDIQHFREASYFLIHFDITPAAVREIERGLLISEEILRHLVTVIEDRGPVSEDEIEEAAPARADIPDGAKSPDAGQPTPAHTAEVGSDEPAPEVDDGATQAATVATEERPAAVATDAETDGAEAGTDEAAGSDEEAGDDGDTARRQADAQEEN